MAHEFLPNAYWPNIFWPEKYWPISDKEPIFIFTQSLAQTQLVCVSHNGVSLKSNIKCAPSIKEDEIISSSSFFCQVIAAALYLSNLDTNKKYIFHGTVVAAPIFKLVHSVNSVFKGKVIGNLSIKSNHKASASFGASLSSSSNVRSN